MNTFEVRDKFYLNGEAFQIISGAVHYFRIVPEYWRDRLEKLKAMGCNTVETYVAWNVHEPEKGKFCFEGMYDIKRFVELSAELGLWVIIRPSPYICAEWEFGGMPAWLLAEDGMRLRSVHGPFLKHVRDYFQVLFEILKPLQFNYGGPIILMQVENEYGYYSSDTSYIDALREIMLDNGVTVPLITSDGPWDGALERGSTKGALPTANFGSKAREQLKVLSKYTDGGPLMCTEFWIGWFDSWGCGKHNTSDMEENAANLDEILKEGNVNIYMFIGGTNFGFMNGANYYDELSPDTTSYDYDAALTEAGALTPKYHALKAVISKYAPIPELSFSTQIKTISYGKLKCIGRVGLFNVLETISEGIESVFPVSMERVGQSYGYILYRSTLEKEKQLNNIRLYDANDRANIFLNHKPIITLYDLELLKGHDAGGLACENGVLDILVENMGRVNYGLKLDKQRKGIDSAVEINGHHHQNWALYPLPLDNIDKLDFSRGYTEGRPAFYRFELNAQESGDTYLDFEGWGKGCAFINGFNLGRFWQVGPQKRLYIPGPLIRKGKNEIILFETEGKAGETISLEASPGLG